MGGAVEHPDGKLGCGARSIGGQVMPAKGCGGGVAMADDGREFVFEPYPALIVGEPGSARCARAKALLVHAVGNRRILCLVFANFKRTAFIADSAESERFITVDGERGIRCHAA